MLNLTYNSGYGTSSVRYSNGTEMNDSFMQMSKKYEPFHKLEKITQRASTKI